METAYDFLKANIFHIATVDKGKPRVRPFGFVMKRDNRLYLCTNKNKEVYKNLKDNPVTELSAVGKDGMTWLRVRGTVEFDESKEAKAQVFEEAPQLLKIYPKGADDEVFVTFYFKEANAKLFSIGTQPKDVPLI
ncbi:MAG TPA: pyridoxamine 5'-phosphate oxidase family protein [Syntrophorhabdaceae bacterium]|nr:pyridoxamine 5'-phosphate oxidase family protein [Syntrophorhabdaceae bacterium]HOL05231.1 pyridoxamine 5'-phosphate oxidase family protein [Syntrophorhabdaceae bacterium]HON84814.1 pyridoxamine 5'-phosphate oxidase family protein [Syntrophorhabdaceae bacterium]HOT41925.1 pyridoxamine 5'-phosphate oxidase family protein [Syntrophorhabdaceae bacterium]HPC66392.1 pyridoxamine 5'-phosphate oxidase family protein [Syntrophorhabdaceae bacterium]